METGIVNSPNYRFVIFNSPNDTNLQRYIKTVKNNNTKERPAMAWVRACQPMYSDEQLINEGITTYNLLFPDGTVPSKDILAEWYRILKTHRNETIAVHCIAGLGRAPLLVSIAMIEDGVTALDAITEVRRIRPGALNSPQVKFLASYKPQSRREKSCLLL